MKLIGSSTSPYVRRIRLLLTQANEPYTFADLNIYGEDRDELRRENPALKIPVLHDDGRVLYDSRIISRYLGEKFGFAALDWDQENLLTLVDACTDSLVALLLSIRSGIEPDRELMFFRLQYERIERTLRALENLVSDGRFAGWDYPAICLYTLLDWGRFRELLETGTYPVLDKWLQAQAERPGVAATDPRRA